MAPKIIKTDKPFWMFSMEADTDYLLARMINFLGASFHSRAGFFGQQACEKYMKALTVQRDNSYDETHALPSLATYCVPYDSYFAEKDTIRILEQLDLFDQVGRYGGTANFDPISKGKTISGVSVNIASGAQFAGAWVWTDKHLDDLDGFVFKARSYLDFSTNNFDYLKKILDRDRKSAITANWLGKQPLRVVLTKNNRYFRF